MTFKNRKNTKMRPVFYAFLMISDHTFSVSQTVPDDFFRRDGIYRVLSIVILTPGAKISGRWKTWKKGDLENEGPFQNVKNDEKQKSNVRSPDGA